MQVALLQGEIMCEYNNNNQVSTTPSGLAVEQQIQGDDKMKVYQQVTIPFVSTKTDEQQSEGGENMISESESLLISVSCVVDELHDDLKHGVACFVFSDTGLSYQNNVQGAK